MSPTQHKYKATNVSPMIEEIGRRAWLSCSTDDPNTKVLIETDRTTLIELCEQIQMKLAARPRKQTSGRPT
jgi:hypothetical protein